MDHMTADVLRYAAFTDHGQGGNPAGVVLDATGLTDTDMLAIAADVGYSETAFLTPTGEPARFEMRYFSPRAEVAVQLGRPGAVAVSEHPVVFAA